MKIKRHISAACDGVEPIEIEFNTKAELLNIPFVLDFRMHPFFNDRENLNFKKYSLTPYFQTSESDGVYLLMAEYRPDTNWEARFYVVGYITKREDEELDLPKWVSPK